MNPVQGLFGVRNIPKEPTNDLAAIFIAISAVDYFVVYSTGTDFAFTAPIILSPVGDAAITGAIRGILFNTIPLQCQVDQRFSVIFLRGCVG